MKVRQLINILQEEDLDLEVKIANDRNCNEIYSIQDITINDNNTIVILIPNKYEGILQ